jgi:Pyridoxamine 5'-phosphate oxidase
MHGAGSPATDDEFTRLDRAESLRLLATVPVGRLIFTANALPTVRPMNFALVDELIVLRTAVGTAVALGSMARSSRSRQMTLTPRPHRGGR